MLPLLVCAALAVPVAIRERAVFTPADGPRSFVVDLASAKAAPIRTGKVPRVGELALPAVGSRASGSTAWIVRCHAQHDSRVHDVEQVTSTVRPSRA